MKNDKQWHNIALHELAYRGENEEEWHSKNDLIQMTNGNLKTAELMFNQLDWESPATFLDQCIIYGEIDENYNILPQI